MSEESLLLTTIREEQHAVNGTRVQPTRYFQNLEYMEAYNPDYVLDSCQETIYIRWIMR